MLWLALYVPPAALVLPRLTAVKEPWGSCAHGQGATEMFGHTLRQVRTGLHAPGSGHCSGKEEGGFPLETLLENRNK